jgi:hypothetical protein
MSSYLHFHPAPAWARDVGRYPACSIHLGSNNDSGHNVRCSFSHSHASRQCRCITIIISLGSACTADPVELVTFSAAQVREAAARATTEVEPSGREIQDARSSGADVAAGYKRTLKPSPMTAEVRPRPVNFDVLQNLFSTALVREYDRLVPMLIGSDRECDLSPYALTFGFTPLMCAARAIVKSVRSDEVADIERKGVVHSAGKSARSPGHDNAPFGRHDCVPKGFAPLGSQGPPEA